MPVADRSVVSFHDAFPYFAAAYGLTIVGTVVDAPGQDPSAGAIGDLDPRDADGPDAGARRAASRERRAEAGPGARDAGRGRGDSL